MYKIIYTERYNKRAAKFFISHPEILSQYEKVLKLLELDPSHPSLRLHKLKGKLSDLYSVSINITYRLTIIFMIRKKQIIPIDIGKHDDIYQT